MKLVDGPGPCAGRLEIQMNEGGVSARVADSQSIRNSLPQICRLLGCGNKVREVEEKFGPGSSEFFPFTVKCGAQPANFSDCIEYQNAISILRNPEALMVTCEGVCAAS